MKAKNLLVAIPWLIAAALIGGVGYGIIALLGWMAGFLSALDAEVLAAIIATVGTALAGVGAVILSQRRAKSRDIAEAHRPKKVEVYSNFIKGVIDNLIRYRGAKMDRSKVVADKQLMKFFADFTTDLILWGGPHVIRTYMGFRASSMSGSREVLLEMDKIFRAIRRDLGHSNRRLKRGDLIKLFLTDPERLDELL